MMELTGKGSGIIRVDHGTDGLALMLGMPIIESAWMPDTWSAVSIDPILRRQVLFVGTRPPRDPVKLAGREARLQVRRGLADVLAWLGQTVENEPVLAAIKNGYRR